uniref:Ribosome-binding factor A n=2 Tax=Hemiselmis andersenii TaxID=464988 RepID=A0A6U2E1N8_HEMAN
MGKMVMQELMSILRGPVARNIDDEMLAQAMLLKVSIVDVEMSPDVKVAKVHVSVIGEEALQKDIVAWMQENNKQLRYELAQSMKHLRTVPTLKFVSADVGAAMDVMSILDKISKERESKDGSGEEEG